MFTKVLILCVVAAAYAIEYPHGMHPALCPNFPICDADVLMRHTYDGTPIPEWEMPYHYALPYVRAFPYTMKYADIAARYPADVDPATCPNYPYCK